MITGQRFIAILKAQKGWVYVRPSEEGYDWYVDRDDCKHSVRRAADMTSEERREVLLTLGCAVPKEDGS
jgi:hypothetical protein